jgi:hypothetical protein
MAALARILFEEMECLAPSSPDSPNEWLTISEWDRALYINCIDQLCGERDLIERAQKHSDNDTVFWRPDTRK